MAFLQGLGVPASPVFAVLLIAAEFLGGLLLMFGLFTRWATIPPLIAMLTALALVHAKNGFFISNGGYEFVLTLMAGLVAILLLPSSKISLDYLFFTHHL